MLVLDGRYAVEDGAPAATQLAYDLLLDRPVALVRLTGPPPTWQGERAARRLRLAWGASTDDGPVDVGVEQDGLYVVLPVISPSAPPEQRVCRTQPPVVADEPPPSGLASTSMPLCRTALAAGLGLVTALAAALGVDGLLG